MPSNVFIYQLPIKETVIKDDDLFIVEDAGTKQVSASALRDYVYEYVVPSLSATEFISTSARFNVIDVLGYELSGFTVKGELKINQDPNKEYALFVNTNNAVVLPVGTSLQRPQLPRTGSIRFNTDDNTFEGYNDTEWSALGETITDRFVDVGAGNIEPGQIVPKGTSLQDLVDTMFTKTYFPTKTDPFATTSFSLASVVEAGTLGVTITITYNRGNIFGRTEVPPGTWNPPSDVSGVWNPGIIQNPYAGIANLYTIAGLANGTNNQRVIAGQTIADGVNTFSSTVNFDQGPIPYDSKGGNYSAGLPRRAAGSVNTSGNITGARRVWWGTNVTTPVNANIIRALGNSIFNNSNNSPIAFTINIPSGATNVLFAIPAGTIATRGNPTVIQRGGGIQVDISNIFVTDYPPTDLDVPGANNYTAAGDRRAYKIFLFTPPTPFSESYFYDVSL